MVCFYLVTLCLDAFSQQYVLKAGLIDTDTIFLKYKSKIWKKSCPESLTIFLFTSAKPNVEGQRYKITLIPLM